MKEDVGQPAKWHRLLVVDDEEFVHERARSLLFGRSVSSAFSARDAREHLGRCVPDVVLLDLNLPEGSGLRLMEEFRGVGCAWIVFTAYPTGTTVMEALRLGAVDYVDKTAESYRALPQLVDAAYAAHRNRPSWLVDLGRLLMELDADAPRDRSRYVMLREQFERLLVQWTLERTDGNRSAAARELGISPATLYAKLK